MLRMWVFYFVSSGGKDTVRYLRVKVGSVLVLGPKGFGFSFLEATESCLEGYRYTKTLVWAKDLTRKEKIKNK